MLLIKAFHIIALVAWFAGLFYLPRLFVYHVDAQDKLGYERFSLMEKRLYYGITWPAGCVTTLLGFTLVFFNPGYYSHVKWFHIKLGLVALLWCFHLLCGHYLKQFFTRKVKKNATFFRLFNEIPTFLLIGIVLLVVLKPF